MNNWHRTIRYMAWIARYLACMTRLWRCYLGYPRGEVSVLWRCYSGYPRGEVSTLINGNLPFTPCSYLLCMSLHSRFTDNTLPILVGYWSFATGVPDRQRTLTLNTHTDTWSHSIWYSHTFFLLRPFSTKLIFIPNVNFGHPTVILFDSNTGGHSRHG